MFLNGLAVASSLRERFDTTQVARETDWRNLNEPVLFSQTDSRSKDAWLPLLLQWGYKGQLNGAKRSVPKGTRSASRNSGFGLRD